MTNSEHYKLKEEFLNEWPLSRIQDLKLEEYTNLDKTSFCYWVEAKTNLLGSIWGGSAYKFGIYKRRDINKEVLNGNRVTDNEYAWHSKYGKTRDEAFATIKLILLEIVESAQNNDLESIDKLNLGDAYRWKIAFLYSDFKIVNIYKWDNLYNAAEFLGFDGDIKSYPALNSFILKKKKIDQDYFDFTHFLWNKSETENNEVASNEENNSFDLSNPNQIFFGPPGTGKTYKINSFFNSAKKTEIKEPITTVKVDRHKTFWHLAPGQGGYLWDDLKNGNRLGYEWCSVDLGNLNDLDKKQTENFKMRTYFSDVKQGDYLCIISGKKFYGIAEALHGYDFSKAIVSGFDFQTIEVKWIKIFDTPELLSASYTPTFGKLNGGKRWNSLIQALQENNIVFNDTTTIESVKLISQSNNSIFTTFHQSFSYEDFIEGIKPDLDENDELRYNIEDGIFKIACDRAANLAGFEDLNDALKSPKEIVQAKFEVSEPFYLFIDEINRGNISQIFGELITLIEKDKRLGQVNETRVTLPYSKNEIQFSVPPNLYIIGTMNTADRSVEALDTALRRRFSFIEMLPDRKVIEDKAFNDYPRAEIMGKINSRIEVLLDRNYTLGHSYFIKENFKNSFKNEIIPLLQEYFYSDYSKIGLILGRGFVREKDRSRDKEVFADFHGIDDIDIQKTFELIPFDELNFDDAIKLLLRI